MVIRKVSDQDKHITDIKPVLCEATVMGDSLNVEPFIHHAFQNPDIHTYAL